MKSRLVLYLELNTRWLQSNCNRLISDDGGGMLLHKEKSGLIVVDVQEKLTPLVQRSEDLIANCQWLMRLATELDVPVLMSQHYAQGLGPIIEPLRALVPGKTEINKLFFSCMRDPSFVKDWQSLNKKQAILVGIETHVCILQTALDLCRAGIEVFVVVNAVSSRKHLDHDLGLTRMQQAGVQLVTLEMVFFEWLEQAGTATFKALSKVFIARTQPQTLE